MRGLQMRARLGLVTAACLTAAGAHAQMSAGERARFVARTRTICVQHIMSDPRMAGASRGGFASICGCAAREVLDSIDPSEMVVRRPLGSAGASDQLSAETREAIQDAVSDCLAQRGGYIPGAAVTPNH
jgi:hypothetical protein